MSDLPFEALAGQAAALAQKPGGIDLGGIAKGYAGNRAAEFLRSQGVSRAVIDLGGDVTLVGQHPEGLGFRVGIRDPFNPAAEPIAVLTLEDTAVFTSGAYERGFVIGGQRYSHILDPRTGRPADSGVASVTIVAEDGIMADALSAAFSVMGLEGAAAFWRSWEGLAFDFVVVGVDGIVTATPGLWGRIDAVGVVFVVE